MGQIDRAGDIIKWLLQAIEGSRVPGIHLLA